MAGFSSRSAWFLQRPVLLERAVELGYEADAVVALVAGVENDFPLPLIEFGHSFHRADQTMLDVVRNHEPAEKPDVSRFVHGMPILGGCSHERHLELDPELPVVAEKLDAGLDRLDRKVDLESVAMLLQHVHPARDKPEGTRAVRDEKVQLMV